MDTLTTQTDIIANFREAYALIRESHHDLPNGGVAITHEAFTALDFAEAQADELERAK